MRRWVNYVTEKGYFSVFKKELRWLRKKLETERIDMSINKIE